MAFLRVARWIILLALAAAAIATAWSLTRAPSREADLAAPAGLGGRLQSSALASDGEACRAVLARAGIAFRPLPARSDGASCGFVDGVAWGAGGAREAHYAPARPPLACALGAALASWEWNVVQPASVRAFGATVTRIDHFGSYACRRIYGRAAGTWSLHARAAAIDVAGFRLSDGRRVTVAADWTGKGPEARFLHEVRDGACRLFGTTLSPDYNAAHRDHLHLDQASRGGFGVCR